MTEVVTLTSWLIGGLAVAVGAVGFAATHDVRSSVALLLDLLLAAGLLRLSADSSWSVLGAAAAIVAIRKLVIVYLPVARESTPRPMPTR